MDYADSSGEFVDVESEEIKDIKIQYHESNLLHDDLQITPENSENEGSDMEMDEESSQYFEGNSDSVGQPETLDGGDVIDENYDPSQFLLLGDFNFQQDNSQQKSEPDSENDLVF